MILTVQWIYLNKKHNMLKIIILILSTANAIISIDWSKWKGQTKERKIKTVSIVLILIVVFLLMWVQNSNEVETSKGKENLRVEEHKKDSLLDESRYLKELSRIEFIANKKEDSLQNIINNSNILSGNNFNKSNLHLVAGTGNYVDINGDVYYKERRLSKKEKDDINSELLAVKKIYPNLKWYIINSPSHDKFIQDIKEFLTEKKYSSAVYDGGVAIGNFQFKGFHIYKDRSANFINIDVGILY